MVSRDRNAPALPALALALSVILLVGGCSDGYRDLPQMRSARVGATSDVNARDPATLRDGGNLRLALTSFPENFNELNRDEIFASVWAWMRQLLA